MSASEVWLFDLLRPFVAEGRLEKLDRLVGLLQRGHEKRHEWLVDHSRVSEKYSQGELGIVIKLDWLRGVDGRDGGQGKTVPLYMAIFKCEAANGHPPDLGDAGYGDKQIMLVPIIELSDEVNHAIPSCVWAQLVNDERFDPLHGLVYESIFNGSLKTPFVFGKRECAPFRIGLDGATKPHPAIIQGASEVMDDIPGHQRNGPWDRLDRICPNVGNAVSVAIVNQRVRVAVDEVVADFLQVRDVLIGPLDFGCGL